MFINTNNVGTAEYLGNLCFDVNAVSATSNRGVRENKEGYTYPVSVVGVSIDVKGIYIDSFLDSKNNLTCHIHVPETHFWIKTCEWAKVYGNGSECLSFKGCVDQKKLVVDFGKISIGNYEDISIIEKKIFDKVTDYITDMIQNHNKPESFKVNCPGFSIDYEKVYHNVLQYK